MALTPASIEIPQPNGDPIQLYEKRVGDGTEFEVGQPQIFNRTLELLAASRTGQVAPHLLAHVVDSARVDESPQIIARIAQDYQAADEAVRQPNIPILYRFHNEQRVGITPHEGTSGFKIIDTNPDGNYPHFEASIPTKGNIKVHGPAYNEGDETKTVNGDLRIYAPLRFLLSNDRSEIQNLIRDTDNLSGGGVVGYVVVGHEATLGLLHEQARHDLQDAESLKIHTENLVTSRAMLEIGSLKRLGYKVDLGQRGDLIHAASIEGLAEVVASSTGFESGLARMLHTPQSENRLLRRLVGVEFDLVEDALEVGNKATELAWGSEAIGRYGGLLYGDKIQVRSHLTEIAGNFIRHFLDEIPNAGTN